MKTSRQNTGKCLKATALLLCAVLFSCLLVACYSTASSPAKQKAGRYATYTAATEDWQEAFIEVIYTRANAYDEPLRDIQVVYHPLFEKHSLFLGFSGSTSYGSNYAHREVWDFANGETILTDRRSPDGYREDEFLCRIRLNLPGQDTIIGNETDPDGVLYALLTGKHYTTKNGPLWLDEMLHAIRTQNYIPYQNLTSSLAGATAINIYHAPNYNSTPAVIELLYSDIAQVFSPSSAEENGVYCFGRSTQYAPCYYTDTKGDLFFQRYSFHMPSFIKYTPAEGFGMRNEVVGAIIDYDMPNEEDWEQFVAQATQYATEWAHREMENMGYSLTPSTPTTTIPLPQNPAWQDVEDALLKYALGR